jgi:hypothetical protein
LQEYHEEIGRAQEAAEVVQGGRSVGEGRGIGGPADIVGSRRVTMANGAADSMRRTAYHEAAHAVLCERLADVRVEWVRVLTPTTGETIPESLSLGDHAVAVFSAGFFAESEEFPTATFDEALEQFEASAYDHSRAMVFMIERYGRSADSDVFRQNLYHQGQIALQANPEGVHAVAEALLAQEGFPRELSGDAVRVLLANHPG